MTKKTLHKRVSFGSLFKKNKDGSLSPATTLSIVGVPGEFQVSDSISNLTLSDRSLLHDHRGSTLSVSKLADTTIIMSFT